MPSSYVDFLLSMEGTYSMHGLGDQSRNSVLMQRFSRKASKQHYHMGCVCSVPETCADGSTTLTALLVCFSKVASWTDREIPARDSSAKRFFRE